MKIGSSYTRDWQHLKMLKRNCSSGGYQRNSYGFVNTYFGRITYLGYINTAHVRLVLRQPKRRVWMGLNIVYINVFFV